MLIGGHQQRAVTSLWSALSAAPDGRLPINMVDHEVPTLWLGELEGYV